MINLSVEDNVQCMIQLLAMCANFMHYNFTVNSAQLCYYYKQHKVNRNKRGT